MSGGFQVTSAFTAGSAGSAALAAITVFCTGFDVSVGAVQTFDPGQLVLHSGNKLVGFGYDLNLVPSVGGAGELINPIILSGEAWEVPEEELGKLAL